MSSLQSISDIYNQIESNKADGKLFFNGLDVELFEKSLSTQQARVKERHLRP